MLPQKQANLNDPANGVYGDCWRTAIACVLDMDRDDVPCPYEGTPPNQLIEAWPAAKERMTAWLRERGLVVLSVQFDGIPLEQLLTCIGAQNPDVHYMLVGNSANGVGHIVVCLNDAIVWDPAIDDSGIVGPCDNGIWYVEFLGKLL